MKRDPRASNARKHGLAVAAPCEPSTARMKAGMAIGIAGPGAGQRQIRAAERLVDTFFEMRRAAEAKLAVLEHAARSGDSDAYARAYCDTLSMLATLGRYQRRAESQFLSASSEYARMETGIESA